MNVAIRPASLWTHAMFATLSALDKAGARKVGLRRDADAELLDEIEQWLSLVSTSHEGPRQKARHIIVELGGRRRHPRLDKEALSASSERLTAREGF